MHRILFILSLLLIAAHVHAQIRLISDHVRVLGYQPDFGAFHVENPVTAIALKAEAFLGNYLTIQVNGITYSVPYDPDAPQYSYFLSLPSPVPNPEISAEQEVTIYLINSGKTPTIDRSIFKTSETDCSYTFSAIPQSEWRAGLTPPDYQRSFTDVAHVIVHHSAGSNTSTDYTQVVRDIYVYHTEVHGWSDIGYNYLIAQNGDIYTGRDPDEGAQDDVLGAHFCGSNSYTMGICLLGNYETAEPDSELWQSLQTLVAFKLKKESLDPQAYSEHPLGLIGSVAGHRDGCNTLCPGENVYVLLDSLRDWAAETLVACGDLQPALSMTIDPSSTFTGKEVNFTNSSTAYSDYQWVLEGADPETAEWKTNGTAVYSTAGDYDVLLIGTLGDLQDTLLLKDTIHVEIFRELDFTASNTVIQPGDTVLFENLSTGYDYYQWLLQGADPDTADWSVNGSTYYPMEGNYDVRLIGYGPTDSDTLVRSEFIQVQHVADLGFTTDILAVQIGESITFTNTSGENYIAFRWILPGSETATATWMESGVTSYLIPGKFDVSLIGYTETGVSDTLTREKAVVVLGDPVIYPNPVTDFGTFRIAVDTEITAIKMYSVQGKQLPLIQQNDGTFQLSGVGTGLYFLEIDTKSGSFVRRLLVH